ncbi:MAG: HAD hydrolase-like protein [Rhabdochlamydiaceae bacterium]|nr:HAD hydrolase-like protein [Rhabdochlamydiaceae bacterium]
MKKKTVFFDLGNVILFFDHKKMYQQMAAFCGLDHDEMLPDLLQYADPYERGAVDSRGIYHHLCTKSNKQLDFGGLMHAMSDIFEPNVKMLSLIKELKAKKTPLYILSNTCEAHFNYAYTHYPILHLFDGYVLSYEVKARKPEKEIFESALSLASCASEDCFYTDDIPEYIEAAKQYKIDAEVYHNHELLLTQLTQRGIL